MVEGKLIDHIVLLIESRFIWRGVEAIKTNSLPLHKKEIHYFFIKNNLIRIFVPNFVDLTE